MSRIKKTLLLLESVIEIVDQKVVDDDRNSFTNALEAIVLEYGRKNSAVVRTETTPQMANKANQQNRSIIAQNVKANSITINDGEEHA